MDSTFLIADSGSTKTDWVVTKGGARVASFQSAGINPFYQLAEEIIPVLDKQVLPHIEGDIDKIFFYGAGCADEKSGRPVSDALKHCIRSASVIEVASDMLGAARGLCGHSAGLACILGTGANNAFYDGEKIVHSIGSLGFWLGDEGSGSYLGKTLVVNYLQNDLPGDLHQKFAEKYPEINRLYILDQAYKKPYPNRFFASFSVFISEHLSNSYILDLLREAFSLFTEKYILKHKNADQYPVHFTGSIAFYYQDILQTVLTSKGLQPGRILKTPLDGLVQYYL
ncbi:N-acetylglucosamine kinase [Dyadobacter aurulentus]|uniref:N-acetylglucosamine kinase n=1 Tax=Dyadobacter sp. UC 10 TaxID=2605428 RepID=UPI0011F2CA13|nr:N-acetylglucosamine kinase [Dyadobacter sp. UC 10]KAA0990705.1 N-acetylglucosamine kinase [Dyadobacter sp. UC 10]